MFSLSMGCTHKCCLALPHLYFIIIIIIMALKMLFIFLNQACYMDEGSHSKSRNVTFTWGDTELHTDTVHSSWF